MSRSGLRWNQWNPGLHHVADSTFAEVLSTLPAANAADIPWIIRFFENPASQWASPGAITLARHDHIHVLLGRGLKSEDEAFVIGFTNGSATVVENRQTRLLRALTYLVMPYVVKPYAKKARDRLISNWQFGIFAFAARHLYRKPYQFTDSDLISYRLGFGFGEANPVRDLQAFPFEEHEQETVGEMRRRMKINVAQLEAVYRQEQMLLGTAEANRLDLDYDENHSHLVPPEGIDSDWKKELPARPRGRLRTIFGR